jgi:hypothetical protein
VPHLLVDLFSCTSHRWWWEEALSCTGSLLLSDRENIIIIIIIVIVIVIVNVFKLFWLSESTELHFRVNIFYIWLPNLILVTKGAVCNGNISCLYSEGALFVSLNRPRIFRFIFSLLSAFSPGNFELISLPYRKTSLPLLSLPTCYLPKSTN